MVNKINTLKKKNKPKKLHKGKNRKYSKGINKNIKDGLSLKKNKK